jgi:hypothetical protein
VWDISSAQFYSIDLAESYTHTDVTPKDESSTMETPSIVASNSVQAERYVAAVIFGSWAVWTAYIN